MTNKGWKTSRLRKQVLAAVLAGGMAIASPFAMPTAEASFGDWSGLLGDVIGGVARAESARSYFLALGNNPVVQNQLYLVLQRIPRRNARSMRRRFPWWMSS